MTTKTEARRLAEDFERKAERIRLGLEPAMVPTGDRTVGDVVSWWLENIYRPAVVPEGEERDFGAHPVGAVRVQAPAGRDVG